MVKTILHSRKFARVNMTNVTIQKIANIAFFVCYIVPFGFWPTLRASYCYTYGTV